MADNRQPQGDEGGGVVRHEEQEEEGSFAEEIKAPTPPRHLFRVDDPERMNLTEEETDWALNIKGAIEGSPDVDNLCDFMYVQLALVDQDDIESALDRAYHLQGFREEYGILDSRTDGLRHLGDYVDLFPRALLSFSFDYESTGSYILVHDHKGFNMKAINSEEKLRTMFTATFYGASCLCPDFESIRGGAIMIAECEGYNWTENIDLKTYQRFWSEIAAVYPMNFRLLKNFHCGVFINLLFSMTKKLLPADITCKVDMGCQFDGRLDDIYLIPTVESANKRLLERMGEALRRRYENMKTFSLPTN